MNSNYLKSLRIVYFALAMGIILFLLVALLLNNLNGALSGSDLTTGEKAPFLVTLVLITGAIFIAYRSIIPKKTIAIQSLPSLDRKLAAWRELNIVQGALIETPSFFAIVLFMLLGVYALLVWPVAGLYIFWLTQPTRDKLVEETKLSISDTEEFDKME
jgi:ribose/xylose/arabinose/galactoside ABC-type transport system permease subunit